MLTSRSLLIASILLGFVLTILSIPHFFLEDEGWMIWKYEYHTIDVAGQEPFLAEFAVAGLPLTFVDIRTQSDFPSREWYQEGHVARTVQDTGLRDWTHFFIDLAFWSLSSWLILKIVSTILKTHPRTPR